VAAAVLVGGVGAYALLPSLVEHRIRATLVERGFPEASLRVASVGFDRLALRDVHLAPGLEIGSLDLDRGVSLLWRDVHDVSIRDARVTQTALVRAARDRKPSKSASSKAPFARLRVSDSVVHVRDTDAAVDGTVATNGGAFDVRVTVTDPSPKGWSVEGSGRVVAGKDITLENGHVAVVVTRESVGSATVSGAVLTAEVAGNLSALELAGSGELRSGRVQLGPVQLADPYVPFAFGSDYLQVKSGTVSVYGGELAVEPTTLRAGAASVSLRARGLQLKHMLVPTKRLTGSGLIDGSASIALGKSGWSLLRAELHARDGGTLRVSDPALQRAATKPDSPFAVQKAIANALTDFRFQALSATLTSPAETTELKVATRGRGRKNQQELDISIAVRGARDALARLLEGVP
jgi:hypothetical protein